MPEAARHYCTQLDRHSLAQGLALISSLADNERASWRIHVVCLDELSRVILDGLGHTNVITIPLHAIERGDDALMRPRATRPTHEYHAAVTPAALLYVLERLEAGTVVTYLEPSQFFYGCPKTILEALGKESILLDSGASGHAEAEKMPRGRGDLRLACFRNDDEGIEALNLWRERRVSPRPNDPPEPRRTDTTPFDDWEPRFARMVILENAGTRRKTLNSTTNAIAPEASGKPALHGKARVVSPHPLSPDASSDGSLASGTSPFTRYTNALRDACATIRSQHPTFEFGTATMNTTIKQTSTMKPKRPLNDGSREPSRDAVLEALMQSGTDAPLADALENARQALAAVFASADLPAARGILVGLIATTLEAADSEAVAPTADATTSSTQDQVHALATAIQAAADANDLDKADAALAELLTLLPESADVHLTAGHLGMRRGNMSRAQDSLVRAGILVDEDDAVVKHDIAEGLVELANNFLSRGEHAVARLNAERAIRLDPTNAAAVSLAQRLSAPVSAVNEGSKPVVHGRPSAAAASYTSASSGSLRGVARPVVSIVVLCWNSVEDTKKCLGSIDLHTRVAHEVIVVDNASSDGTAEFLRAWANGKPHVRLIFNRENLGFAGGNNVGMAAARGEYILLLNNDTIVTNRWVESMLSVFAAHPRTGLVGPRSNFVAGPQVVQNVPYRNDQELNAFADSWSTQQRDKSTAAAQLIGFCLMIRREVLERIGGLDTRFGKGNYEDNDFCYRARFSGFDCRISDAAFVHHEGHKTFKANHVDLEGSLEETWTIFKAKWGIAPSVKRLEQLTVDLQATAEVMRPIPLPTLDHYASTADGAILTDRAVVPSSAVRPALLVAERDALFNEGERAAAAGNWTRALELFESLASEHPEFSPSFIGIASASFAAGNIDRGLAALDNACMLEPNDVPLHVQRGRLLLQNGKLIRATAAFQDLVTRAPTSVDARLGLAEAHRLQEHPIQAIDTLEAAHRAFPTEPAFIAAIGTLAAELGDNESALGALKALQSMAPTHPRTRALEGALEHQLSLSAR